MKKLIVIIIGQNCEKFIGMNLDSVKDADHIFYLDGDSTDKSKEITLKFQKINPNTSCKTNKWNPKDKAMNGKQRNFYLKYLKENYPDDWALCLDADEIVEDLSKIKEFIQKVKPGIYNVKMRHFIGDLGHEDATRPVHVVPGRLFKISEAIKYPEHSHPVLEGELMGGCLDTVIWHLGHLPVEYMDYILKRYKEHSNDSIIHNQEFLKGWKFAHLFGQYPVKQINPVELPKQICERYEINKDEFYFQNRGLEVKHFIMAKQWIDYFNDRKISYDNKESGLDILEFGCGKAPFGYIIDSYGHNYYGIEISKFAVNNAFIPIKRGNIINYDYKNKADLVILFDILEHLNYKDLNKAIENSINASRKYLLVSIPVNGDPNLLNDTTHKIFEDKDWWIKKFTDKGLKLIPTPEHFLFKEQIMIFKK